MATFTPRRSSPSAPRRPSRRCCPRPSKTLARTRAPARRATPSPPKARGRKAVLANAYHLYLQPGPEIVEQAGGVGAFMNWPGPTFTDSGGFQVLSLGAGFRKVLAMDLERLQAD